MFSFNSHCCPLFLIFWTDTASRQEKGSDESVTGKTLSLHFDSLVFLLFALNLQNNRVGIPITTPETAEEEEEEEEGYPRSALFVWQEQLGKADA